MGKGEGILEHYGSGSSPRYVQMQSEPTPSASDLHQHEGERIFEELPRATVVEVLRADLNDLSHIQLIYTFEIEYKKKLLVFQASKQCVERSWSYHFKRLRSKLKKHYNTEARLVNFLNKLLKWSNHKARHRKRTVSKQRHHTSLLSQSDNVRLTNVANEEQSLEQNAARMLSSRFSSQCGNFSLNGSSTAQQTTEPGNSSLPLNSQVHSTNDPKKTEITTPKQNTSRALRPRKRRQKASGTRRYKEICFSETDAFKILDMRIKVFWPLDIKWYYGSVKSYDPTNKLHYVRYDDHDEEWLSLKEEKFKLQLLPGETAGKFKMSENFGCGKVGRFTNGTHAVPGTSHPEELNNEIHSSTVDNDALTCRTENRSFKKHDSAVLDAPCMPSRNGGEGSGRKEDNSFLPPKDNNSIVERLNFHNVSDKGKSGNVYVRRRYRKTGSGLKATDESVVKTGEGKVNAFQKLIETPIKKLEQGFCDGKDVGQSLFSNNSKHTNILSPKNILLPERPPTSIEGQECYRWSEDNMVSEIIANENKLEHSQFDNDLVMLSKLSAGPRKDLLSYQGSELALRIIHSLEEYQPQGGAAFISHMRLLKYLIIFGHGLRCFISSKELNRKHPILSLWNFLPPLYPGYGLQHVCCHNNLIRKQCGMILPVWPIVWLDILVVDNFSGSSLFSFGGSLWEVVNGFNKIMISILNPLQNKCSCMFLGSMKLVDVQVPVPSVSVQISFSQGFSKPLSFLFYNFQVISRAKLKDLKRTLEVLYVLQKKSPLQSRNNANLCFFGSCNGQMSGHMAFKNSVMFVQDSGMTVPLFHPRANILNVSVAFSEQEVEVADVLFGFPESTAYGVPTELLKSDDRFL